jgi:hypothetical protein
LRAKSVTISLAVVLVALASAGSAEDGRASEDGAENQATTEGSEGEKGGGRKATLELQGESGTEFSGSCTVGDQDPEEISGQVPETYTYRLKKRPLDCQIYSDGEVQVDLTVGKNIHSVQRISGGTLDLTYEKGSISSVVSSPSGSNVQSSSSSSQKGDNTSESGSITSEQRDVSGFEEVELRGMGNLSIRQADSESLTVEAEEDVLPKIKTKVKNNRLIIGPKRNTTINTTEPIDYELTVENLSALEVSGSGDVEAEGISTDELAVTISGTGDVEISGEADSQNVDVSGSGDYQAEGLESREASVDVGGSGSATVNVSDELDAEVSGSGSIEYIGEPTVRQDVSGAGEVSER